MDRYKFRVLQISDGTPGHRYDEPFWKYFDLGNALDPFAYDMSTVCQFTGLSDENGNDIYEYDILSRNHMKDGYVRFESGSFRIMIDTPKGLRNYVLGVDDSDLSLVIGNIYQNSELLK